MLGNINPSTQPDPSRMSNQAEYWEQRLHKSAGLNGVTHLSFKDSHNSYLCKAKVLSIEKVRRELRINFQNKDILDVGCGTGFWVNYYSRKNVASITGIDITRASVTLLEERYPEYRFIQCDVSTDIGFRERSDIINIFDVLYHVTNRPAFESSISNISR